MDRENLESLEYFRPGRGNTSRRRRGSGGGGEVEGEGKAKVMLFGDFYEGKKGVIVNDPYYGRKNGFLEVFDQCMKMSEGFMREVLGADV